MTQYLSNRDFFTAITFAVMAHVAAFSLALSYAIS
jgi:hypothetical protein